VSTEQNPRQITAAVFEWYFEFESGVIGTHFDPRVLNYRVDVERLMRSLPPAERELLWAVHRDGMDPANAAIAAKWITTDPDALVESVETRFGRQLRSSGLFDLVQYFNRSARA